MKKKSLSDKYDDLVWVLQGLMHRSRELANDYIFNKDDNYEYWYTEAMKIISAKIKE